MQMLSHSRAVEDLEPLALSEAEVILGPGFIVIKSHKQSHACRKTQCWLWGGGYAAGFHCILTVGFVHLSNTWGCLLCNKNYCLLCLFFAPHLLQYFQLRHKIQI